KGAIYPGIAGMIGPTLCWFSGSGLKGSLMVGTRNQKIGGLVAAIAFACVGIGIVYHSGFWIGLFGAELSGPAWCAIGLILGFLATKREHATEAVINKSDTDAIFSLTRPGWTEYAARIRYPGEEVRLSHFEAG